MNKLLFTSMIALLSVLPTQLAAKGSLPQDILDWCGKAAGKEYWLRTDVIRIQGMAATDATNVFPDGRIYHQGTIEKGFQITTQTTQEFTAEARRKLGFDKEQNSATVLIINKGARVFVHEIEPGAKEVKVKITLKGSWYSEIQSTIRLKFDEGYSLNDLTKSFDVAFAKEEYEIKHAELTKEITAGMSPDEVVRVMGYADEKINLADRMILIYDSLKLIFQDNKLVGAQ